jgi:uroporphyrinogen-III decarboxylase
MGKPDLTTRERWWQAVRFNEIDRLPFWPKLDAAYPRAQHAPFNTMTISEIHEWLGSDEHAGIKQCVREVRTQTGIQVRREGKRSVTTYTTPFGETRMVQQFDPTSQAWHPMEFPVYDLDTIKLMTAFYEDTSIQLDENILVENRIVVEQYGENAFTLTAIGESPLMFFVEWLAGVENAHYLLNDYPEAVEALFQAVHQMLLNKTRLLAKHSPSDVLYMVENTSTTLISPSQYRKYCYHHITEYGNITRAYNRFLFLHMCGKLKLLLPDIGTLPVEGFEAFTAPPLGSTTLMDGRTACPDKALVGGTHAMLWTRPAGEIIEAIERDLDALPHHRGLVVTSAGVMTPLCPPERIRKVREWLKQYQLRY